MSPDFDPTALKYRDMLSISDIYLRAPEEYDVSYNLFVVSTSDDKTLCKGKDFSLVIFSRSKLMKIFVLTHKP